MPRGLCYFQSVGENIDRSFDCGNISPVFEDAAAAGHQEVGGDWTSLVAAVRDPVSRMFRPTRGGMRPYNQDNITLFHNTTAAFEHVLAILDQRFADADATLLTSDLEFTDC